MPDSRNHLVLTLDIGTSSVRAMLWDGQGNWVEGMLSERRHSMTVTPDGGVVTDPSVLLKRTARCIDDVLDQAGKQAKSIVAVGISTFWHSLMGVDKGGKPLTPLLTWADTRSQSAADKLKQQLDERAVHARTGCMLHSSYLPAKLLWLSESNPDVFANACHWLSFGEFLFLTLFNVPLVSLSMASGTGLFEQDSRSWDREMLAAAKVNEEQLGELVDVDRPAIGLRGEWADRWPALENLPWFPALGDGACSNVGSNCSSQNRLALMIGTSGALRVLWRANGVSTPEGLWRYRLDAEHIILGGALSNGGNMVRWLEDTLVLKKRRRMLEEIAKTKADGHGLTVLPFLDGERSPDYRADARGAITGLSLATTPIQIVRAHMEAVCYRFGVLLDLLQPEAPDANEIIANGGAILGRPIWMQMMADVLGRHVIASSEREATSRGAALVALRSLGELPSIEGAPDHLGVRFEPDTANHEIYEKAAQRHMDLYKRLLTGAPSPGVEVDEPQPVAAAVEAQG
jgi:gluconokinase